MISALYRHPVYHQIVFASLFAISCFRTTYLLRVVAPAREIPVDVTATIVKIYFSGVASFLAGFLIWNFDNIFCDILTTWKSAIGWPVAFLLEGHSWWHCFTALGAYFMMLGSTYLTLCIKDTHKNYTVIYSFGFPQVLRLDAAKIQ